MQNTKPFAPSSEENKHVILEAIEPLLTDTTHLLEIASGTGQHAVFFAEKMPHLIWQTSDLKACHDGIQQWINDSPANNVRPPIDFDVSAQWPDACYDAIFSANSFHIMSKDNIEDLFDNIDQILTANAIVMVYGPFNYAGLYTSESNARFDHWLKQQNPKSGIKDFEWCNQLAENAGLRLLKDIEMPQNNRILVWQKKL